MFRLINPIHVNLNQLAERFGDQHDVRFVPSVIIGGCFRFRVTISNLPNIRDVSAKAGNYEEALQSAMDQIPPEGK